MVDEENVLDFVPDEALHPLSLSEQPHLRVILLSVQE
jgi:hypothetical protein